MPELFDEDPETGGADPAEWEAGERDPGERDIGEADSIPDRELRSALEFAVKLAAVGARRRPPIPVPAAMRPFFRYQDRLPAPLLARVRATLEAEPAFFAVVAEVATADLVDEIGLLWLRQPDGWRQELQRLLLIAEQGRVGDTHAVEARREQRRREAAEQRADRHLVELDSLRDQFEAERAAREVAEAELAQVREQLARVTLRLDELERTAQRRTQGARAAGARADAVEEELAMLRAEVAATAAARDTALADRVAAHDVVGVDLERIRELLGEALVLTRGPQAKARQKKRSPIALPGGISSDGEAAAEFLLRQPGVLVLVDGYNVAKLGWPSLSLERQRAACIDAAESIARRWGTLVHVVFDGATVIGAHTTDRRMVRVRFSPEGVLADDVLRADVKALDADRAVLVVTNDRAVRTDVRSDGANTLSSEAFLKVARR